jgi:O-antigen/teichoic acid export membrane protein
MDNSRTRNSVFNISAAFLLKICTIFTSFVSRTIIIYILGDVVLGLNSLFTTILTVLSLSELGVTSAITYHLYSPMKNKNENKLKEITLLYKTCYRVIGIVMFILGIALIPFLDQFVNINVDYDININVIYIMTLLRSVVSYWFYGFSQVIIEADQKQRVVSTYNTISNLISIVVIILALVLFKNYYIYLLILILFEIIRNIFLYIYTKRNYPWLNDLKNIHISSKLKKLVFKDVYSVFVFKITTTIGQSIDNILISMFISTILVGYYGNYTMIATYVISIATMIINSMGASVGNLHAENDLNKTKKIFYEIDMINFIIMAIFTVCLNQLLTPFILFWLKDTKFVISTLCVHLICANNYIISSLNAIYIFRNALGLFNYGKYNFLACGISNLIFSIILGKFFGLEGVLIATFLSYFIISTYPFPHYLFKYGFKSSPVSYYIEMTFRMVLVILMCLLSNMICKYISIKGLMGLVIQGILCSFVSIMLISICYYKSDKYLSLINRLKNLISRYNRRKK